MISVRTGGLIRPIRPMRLLGHAITNLGYDEALDDLVARSRAGAGGAAFFCNAHMAVEGLREPTLRQAMARADWLFPDGMPIVIASRLMGHRRAQRVAGMDVVPALCARAEREGLPVFFYGGSVQTLAALEQKLRSQHPGLEIAGMISPPFRAEVVDDERDIAAIRASGARLCFVGLGCPKQELWIDRVRDRLDAVLLGVGAAFNTTAGTLDMAPQWMRDRGLEWIFRLTREPGRLTARYLRTNPVFFDRVLRELWTR